MASFVEHVAIAVGADYCAGVDGDAVAELAFSIDDDVGKEADVVAKPAIAADEIVPHENAALAQPRAFARYAMWSDVCGRRNAGRSRDNRAGVNAGLTRFRREEKRQHAGNGDAG